MANLIDNTDYLNQLGVNYFWQQIRQNLVGKLENFVGDTTSQYYTPGRYVVWGDNAHTVQARQVEVAIGVSGERTTIGQTVSDGGRYGLYIIPQAGATASGTYTDWGVVRTTNTAQGTNITDTTRWHPTPIIGGVPYYEHNNNAVDAPAGSVTPGQIVIGSSAASGKGVASSGKTFVESTQGVTGTNLSDTKVPTTQWTQTAIDLATRDLSGAMHFIGRSTTVITDGGTEAPTINGSVVPIASLKAGDVVLYDHQEYVWDGTQWELLGDEGSWALKTTRVDGKGALEGGGTLENNIEIYHKVLLGSTGTYGGVTGTRVMIPVVSTDEYGHIIAIQGITGAVALNQSQIDDAIQSAEDMMAQPGYVQPVWPNV